MVAVTGFDDEHVYYHENGPRDPTANKKVSKELFIKACDAKPTDNDVIVVFGKR